MTFLNGSKLESNLGPPRKLSPSAWVTSSTNLLRSQKSYWSEPTILNTGQETEVNKMFIFKQAWSVGVGLKQGTEQE